MAIKILIVEDELITALQLEAELDHAGFDVIGVASSGEEAIAAAKKSRPDAIVMDFRLQGDMDGIAAAMVIQKTYRDHPPAIVIVTSSRRESLPKGAARYDFIPKPFSMHRLVESIQSAVLAGR